MNKKELKKALKMHKMFRKLHDDAGLVSFCSDSIQVLYKDFMMLFPNGGDYKQETDEYIYHYKIIDKATIVSLEYKGDQNAK